MAAQEYPITEADVAKAQKAWGDGLLAISEAHAFGGNYKELAEAHVDTLYYYQAGDVLFAPTKAADRPFRLTREGALSYFVGGNPDFPEDHGFALQHLEAVRFKPAGTQLYGVYAVSLGHYFFQPRKGDELKVEFTFGYIRDDEGRLRITLHHSALPYSPAP